MKREKTFPRRRGWADAVRAYLLVGELRKTGEEWTPQWWHTPSRECSTFTFNALEFGEALDKDGQVSVGNDRLQAVYSRDADNGRFTFEWDDNLDSGDLEERLERLIGFLV